MQEEWGHEVAAEALPAEGVAMAEVLGVEEGDNMKAPWTIVGEDGTSERKLVFGGTGCEIVEGVVMMAHRWARTRRSPSAQTTQPVTRVAEGPALTNETLRDWVGRWCGGACRDLKGYIRRFDGSTRARMPPISK